VTVYTDDFNRADSSSLGADWTASDDGGLTVFLNLCVGPNNSVHQGNTRTAETYPDDQFSEVEVSQYALQESRFFGPTVRSSTDQQDCYASIYFNSGGTIQLGLFKRVAGTFTQLGSYHVLDGELAEGDKIRLSATGTDLSLTVNEEEILTATDSTLTSGYPGIMMYQDAIADNWSGGGTTMTDPDVVGDFRLLEDGGFRLLEDDSGKRLLEESVGSADPVTASTTQNTRQRAAVIALLNKNKRTRARRRR